MEGAEKEYLQRKDLSNNNIKKALRNAKILTWSKIITFTCGLVITIILILSGWTVYAFIAPSLFIVLFFFLSVLHNKAEDNNLNSTILYRINLESLARLNGSWTELPDNGSELKMEKHPYADDLDILGKASLYQYINTAVSQRGKSRLAQALLAPLLDKGAIHGKQQAIAELSVKIGWRQDLQAMGRKYFKTPVDPERIIDWASTPGTSVKKIAGTAARLLPFVTIALGLANLLFNIVPAYFPLFLLLIHILVLIRYHKRVMEILDATARYNNDIKAYAAMLRLFELEPFSCACLKDLQQSLLGTDGSTTYQQVQQLARIIERADIRSGSLYLFFNVLTLWDVHILAALENWKNRYGGSIKQWIDITAELEVLSSFALITYNHPAWCIPEISTAQAAVFSQHLGHPLLGAGRVTNNLEIREAGTVHLITGSNMSGKSTWLRSLGLNLVLAYNGAPACAAHLECSLLNLYTVMRVRDDLEKGISSFYAELIRIKEILDAARAGKPVLFLLDEIFKGTNSTDRHLGAGILIQALCRQGAIGMVATHDLALGKLAEKNGKIQNYHFQEYYENNSIKFDYLLYPGISRTRNALHLMKMIGLEVEEDLLRDPV